MQCFNEVFTASAAGSLHKESELAPAADGLRSGWAMG